MSYETSDERRTDLVPALRQPLLQQPTGPAPGTLGRLPGILRDCYSAIARDCGVRLWSCGNASLQELRRGWHGLRGALTSKLAHGIYARIRVGMLTGVSAYFLAKYIYGGDEDNLDHPSMFDRQSCVFGKTYAESTGLVAYLTGFLVEVCAMPVVSMGYQALQPRLPNFLRVTLVDSLDYGQSMRETLEYFGFANSAITVFKPGPNAKLAAQILLYILATNPIIFILYKQLFKICGGSRFTAKRGRLFTRIQEFCTNHEIEKKVFYIFDTLAHNVGLATTIAVTINFLINIFYDAEHDVNLPDDKVSEYALIGASIGTFIGMVLTILSPIRGWEAIYRIRFAISGFIGSFIMLMNLQICKDPDSIMVPEKFVGEGVKYAYGFAALSTLAAVMSAYASDNPADIKSIEPYFKFQPYQLDGLTFWEKLPKFFANGLGHVFSAMGIWKYEIDPGYWTRIQEQQEEEQRNALRIAEHELMQRQAGEISPGLLSTTS